MFSLLQIPKCLQLLIYFCYVLYSLFQNNVFTLNAKTITTISRDGNLWRSNIWRLSLLYCTPPPQNVICPPPPPHPQNNQPSPQIMMTWEWIRTLYQVLHEVHSMKIHFHHSIMTKIIFSVTKYVQKCPETLL